MNTSNIFAIAAIGLIAYAFLNKQNTPVTTTVPANVAIGEPNPSTPINTNTGGGNQYAPAGVTMSHMMSNWWELLGYNSNPSLPKDDQWNTQGTFYQI
jgi:hypothetical protein